MLQCGHGHEAVENLQHMSIQRSRFRTSFNAATAMRPWRTSVDIVADPATAKCFNAATAMRPWRTRGGNYVYQVRPRTLQCGHGHEAVENSVGNEYNPAAEQLQCGHGHEAVENGSYRSGRYRP